MKMTMTQSNAREIRNGETLPRRAAIIFIVFLGIVSLFGDMTYEGARGIVGPYLGLLGVTATPIGIISAVVLASALLQAAALPIFVWLVAREARPRSRLA